MVDAAFAQRRKTLRAALAALGRQSRPPPRPRCAQRGSTRRRAASTLTVEQFAAIAGARPRAVTALGSPTWRPRRDRRRGRARPGAGEDQPRRCRSGRPATTASTSSPPCSRPSRCTTSSSPPPADDDHASRSRAPAPTRCPLDGTQPRRRGPRGCSPTAPASPRACTCASPSGSRSPAAWPAGRPTPPAALLACDALWRTGLARDELRELAAELGTDVPFSLLGGTAVGTGRGERLTPALARGEYHWVLAPGRATACRPRRSTPSATGCAQGRDVPEPQVPPAVMQALRTGDAVGARRRAAQRPAARRPQPGAAASSARSRSVGASRRSAPGLRLRPDRRVPRPRRRGRRMDLAVALSASGTCGSVLRASGPVAGARLVEPVVHRLRPAAPAVRSRPCAGCEDWAPPWPTC